MRPSSTRISWQPNGVCVTSAFPPKTGQLEVRQRVILCAPDRVVPVMKILRFGIIKLSLAQTAGQERDAKDSYRILPRSLRSWTMICSTSPPSVPLSMRVNLSSGDASLSAFREKQGYLKEIEKLKRAVNGKRAPTNSAMWQRSIFTARRRPCIRSSPRAKAAHSWSRPAMTSPNCVRSTRPLSTTPRNTLTTARSSTKRRRRNLMTSSRPSTASFMARTTARIDRFHHWWKGIEWRRQAPPGGVLFRQTSTQHNANCRSR